MIDIIFWCKSQIKDLQNYKRSKEDLLESHVKARLDKSYKSYEQELNASLDYLKRRNELNVTKKLNRMSKK